MPDLTVGTATAAPGTRARGVIPVTNLPGGRALEIPVIVLNGVAERPVHVGRCCHSWRRTGGHAGLPYARPRT